MENAKHARQTQERIIDFEKQAIEKLDYNRRSVLEVIIKLQLPLTQRELPPNGLLLELSQQVKQTITEMERISRAMPEEIRRLRRIEDGQREAQGMDDQQLLEMVGRYVQEEQDRLVVRQAIGPSEEAGGICSDCIIP